MPGFLGEYDCRLDEKGRVKVPSALVRQFPTEANNTFILNRGFEEHLILYPKNEWDLITADIGKLNPYDRKTREFRRYFYRGASEIEMDSAGRLLFPKKLLEWAKIDKDIVLFAHDNLVEIWDKDTYENFLSNEPADFASLAELVMGSKNREDKNE